MFWHFRLVQQYPLRQKTYKIDFQKGSLFVDDANSLIQLAKQMGLIDFSYYNHMPNATKCNTINDIYQSHVDDLVILEVDDIYGMLILLSLGIGGALLLLSFEMVFKVKKILINMCQIRYCFL